MFKKAKENKKGFTLAELLIVVAIIAVLVAISIPIFTSQLEKSREATDAANLRAAYAEASADMLTNDASTYSKHIDAVQTQ
ncbi:MAG: prepilin-type N-terminal cleavage/methylation domain-containing protein, partial [Clostridia bacterium]|nr:prepilin-type N-terminal cleavage/methylation domain-containing protein [Clostridia bacterium]